LVLGAADDAHHARGEHARAQGERMHQAGPHPGRGSSAARGGTGNAHRSRITVARPRKLKKPTTSVTAVTTTPPATAGSTSARFMASGTSTPASAAEAKLITSAAVITSPSSQSRNHANATSPTK